MKNFYGAINKNPQSPKQRDKHRRYSCAKKLAWTLDEATRHAHHLNAMQNRPYAVHVYRCLHCPAYHVGRLSPWLRAEHVRVFVGMEYEVGERVWGNVMGENFGPRKVRRNKIEQRYNSRFRKLNRVWSENTKGE